MALETLCLDAGGVLVHPNWQRVSDTLARHGVRVTADALRRADPTAKFAVDVGDLYHVDVVVARRAGLQAILLDAAGLVRGLRLRTGFHARRAGRFGRSRSAGLTARSGVRGCAVSGVSRPHTGPVADPPGRRVTSIPPHYRDRAAGMFLAVESFGLPMVWFFERESHTLRYEIRRRFDGTAFEVVISDSEGERLQQLTSPTELLQHSERVWAGLIDSGWRPLTPRIFAAPPTQ